MRNKVVKFGNKEILVVEKKIKELKQLAKDISVSFNDLLKIDLDNRTTDDIFNIIFEQLEDKITIIFPQLTVEDIENAYISEVEEAIKSIYRGKFYRSKEGYFSSYEISIEELIFFAKEYGYNKIDIEELTVREKFEMFNSDIAVYVKQVNYYEDMSKFAKLGLWIIQCLGGDIDDIESLIGEYPTLQNKRELTQDDLELIEFAKQNGLKYKITNTGIKISA